MCQSVIKILLFGLLLAGLVLLVCWFAYARSWLPIGAALAVPGYLIWKLPIYLRLLSGREKNWVRTDRGAGPAGKGTSGG